MGNCWLVLGVLFGAASYAAGQDGAVEAPEAAAFEAAFQSYKDSAREFEKLRSEYQNADDGRRGEINAQLGDSYSVLKPKADDMVTSALAAYVASPNTDDDITDLLIEVAAHDLRGVGENKQGADQYERALAIVSALIDGGLAEKNPKLPIWGIVAAFVTGDLDQVERFKRVAEEAESFAQAPEQSDSAGIDLYRLALDYSDDRALAAERRLWEQENAVREAEAAADDLPRVKFTTSKGDIVLELFENEAPQAVANMVSLVKRGYYDGLTFHRVLPSFMAQGGDPSGDGTGGPGYCIRCECYQKNARMHFRGSLSMAKTAQRDTGGSQFFLTFVPTRHLDGKHTVFGRVIDGIEVLADLQRINPGQRGGSPDKIVTAEVLRDRGHAYEFDQLPER